MRYPIALLAAGALLTPMAQAAGNEFNPQISLIFDGVFYQDNVDGEGVESLLEVPGINGHGHEEEEGEEDHDHGHSHGLEEGFNLREQELTLSASVDNYFDGFVVIAVSEEEVEVEEAYFVTRSLPNGFTVKGGKFFSGIGYHNSKHVHSWDFVDQNLAYGALLGDHGLVDKGLQLTWLPSTSTYALFGVEWLQGSEQERFGTVMEEPEEDLGLDEEETGPKIVTAFVKVSPDLGDDHALQVGAWYAQAKQDQQELHHEHDGDEEELGLEGDASMWGLELVYKLDSTEAYGAGDLTVQAEYLMQNKDWEIMNGDEAGEDVSGEQDGFYLQTVYGIAPRWKAGLRYDVTGLTNDLELPEETESFDESDRISAAVTFYPTEFSFIRLQYATADIAESDENIDQVFLQFNYSLGAHGAHKF
ncbi:MAG: TonB-dependent receptor [Pseudomonadales bacterium]|nr:TonB-dependent receptor [Pseudomonadales bacterium]